MLSEGKSYDSILKYVDGELGGLENKVTKKKEEKEKAEKDFVSIQEESNAYEAS